jgi:hypothetical protein
MTRVLQILVVVPKLRKTKGSGTRNDMIAAFGAAVCNHPRRSFFQKLLNSRRMTPEIRQRGGAGEK